MISICEQVAIIRFCTEALKAFRSIHLNTNNIYQKQPDNNLIKRLAHKIILQYLIKEFIFCQNWPYRANLKSEKNMNGISDF